MAVSVLRASVLAGVFATSLLSTVALADIALPGPDSCVIESVAKGRDCIRCRGVRYDDPDFCARQPTAIGRTFECKTWGATSWGEIWCAPAAERGGSVAEVPAEEVPVQEAPAAEATATDDPTVAGGMPRENAEIEPTPNSKKSGKGCNAGAALPGAAAAFGAVGLLLARRRRRA